MSRTEHDDRVVQDLNNPVFQRDELFSLQKPERLAELDTLGKLLQLTWTQVYRDKDERHRRPCP